MRRGNAGDCIGRSRPGCHQHHAGLAGRTRIAIRCMGSPLLMAYKHMMDIILLEECVIDMQHRSAGIAKNSLNTFVLQRLDDDLSTTEFHLAKTSG